MAHASAAHIARLRRLALTKEVQQMAVRFVKYGSAAYFFRAYVMGVTAVNDRARYCKSVYVVLQLTSDTASYGLLHVSAVHRAEHVSHIKHQG